MGDYIFKEWLKAMEKLQNSLEKDVEEVRLHKTEVQQMKSDIFNSITSGQYIRDDSKIVISAPEIIIGNVDKSGDLWAGGGFSKVTIRANDIAVEGSGAGGVGGSITNRASTISNIAVDPGMDGCENVVGTNSSIVNQARSIVLQSNDETKCFSQAVPVPGSGIYIHADKGITVDSSASCEQHTKEIESWQKKLKDRQKDLKEKVSNGKHLVSSTISSIEDTLDSAEGNNEDLYKCAANWTKLNDIQNEYEELTASLYTVMTSYLHDMAELAEVNREISAMEETKKALSSKKSNFLKDATGSRLSLNSESIVLSTMDGDNNIRESDAAGVFVSSKRLAFDSMDKAGSLIKDSTVSILTGDVYMSTANPKPRDKNCDFPAAGEVRIVSKNVSVEAVDYELKDDKVKEKALTKDGSFSVRAERISVNATDTEGKSTGSVDINAKAIGVKSMDVDKESREEKQLAAGSTMVLVSEKMFAGALEKDKNKSKQVQISSEKIGVIAKTTAEIQQEKATVQLDGGNLSVSGSKTAVFGETTVNGKTEFKGEVKAPKLTADNLEAKSSFKTTNISDGIAVPAAPSSASLSQKIKEEAAPKPEPPKKKEKQ